MGINKSLLEKIQANLPTGWTIHDILKCPYTKKTGRNRTQSFFYKVETPRNTLFLCSTASLQRWAFLNEYWTPAPHVLEGSRERLKMRSDDLSTHTKSKRAIYYRIGGMVKMAVPRANTWEYRKKPGDKNLIELLGEGSFLDEGIVTLSEKQFNLVTKHISKWKYREVTVKQLIKFHKNGYPK